MPHHSSVVLDATLGRADLCIDWDLNICGGWETEGAKEHQLEGEADIVSPPHLSLLLELTPPVHIFKILSIGSPLPSLHMVDSPSFFFKMLSLGEDLSAHIIQTFLVWFLNITRIIFSQPLPPSDILVPIYFLISSLSPHKTVSSGTRCFIFIAGHPRPGMCWYLVGTQKHV